MDRKYIFPLTICEPYNQTKPACNDAFVPCMITINKFVISSCNFPSQDSKLLVKLCCDIDPNKGNLKQTLPIFLKTQITFSTK